MTRPTPTVENSILLNVPKGTKLLIAVSGGIDSVVLLNGCSKLATQLKLQLGIAHFNHRLREKSDQEEEFVRGVAESYKIPFFF